MAVKRKTAAARAQAPAKKSKLARPVKRSPAKGAARKPAQKAATKPAARAKPARARSASAQAMFQKVAFTMLSVEDPMRARDFYENVLGLTRGLGSPDGTWTEYD